MLLGFLSFQCNGMSVMKAFNDTVAAMGETVENASSLKNEFNVRTGLGLVRKDEVVFNFTGSTFTLLASLCAVSYGCSNLFKKDSSKLGALFGIATGIFGVGYSCHELHVHSQAYKPYLK